MHPAEIKDRGLGQIKHTIFLGEKLFTVDTEENHCNSRYRTW